MKDTNYLQMIEEVKMEATIYGDAFVYAVPYKKAVAILLHNKNNIKTGDLQNMTEDSNDKNENS